MRMQRMLMLDEVTKQQNLLQNAPSCQWDTRHLNVDVKFVLEIDVKTPLCLMEMKTIVGHI